MKFMSVVVFTVLAMPGIGYTQSQAIELPKLIEAFMVNPGSNPEWEMGAGKSMPEIKWISSGIESHGSASYRRGTTRVLLNGKEMQHLRQRLEPVPWKIVMVSDSPAKLGPEQVSIAPSCDTVQCEFDFKKAMSVEGFSLKKICEASPVSQRITAYEVRKSTAHVYAVVADNLGSGGASTELRLFFSAPSPASNLCARMEMELNSRKEEGFITEVLRVTSSEINSKLPIMIDSETRIDSTVVLNKNLQYNITLINYPSFSVSASELNNAFGQTIINNVCAEKRAQTFRKHDVTVSYAYFGNDGKKITTISVLPSQCGDI